MKNTKGPWRSDKWEIIGGDNSVVAKVIPWDASGCREEDKANAHLIAAAPDLYDALDELLRVARCGCCSPNCDACRIDHRAERALIKARGES